MTRVTSELSEIAAIHLRYALAEIMTNRDDDSLFRALDHIGQADECLRVLMAECDIAPNEPEAKTEAATISGVG